MGPAGSSTQEEYTLKHALKSSIVAVAMIAAAGTLAGWNSVNETVITDISNESSLIAKTYDVDPTHSGVVFKVRHRGVSSFYGQFSTIQGTIEFDKLHIERSSMELVVPIKSILTGDRTRDGHIKGADFLNMRQYPEASFVSSEIKELSEGVYSVTGDFTLGGKTAVVVARLSDVQSALVNGSKLMGFEASFSIKRSDFGITKYVDPKDPEGGSLGETVELTVFIEAVGR